MIMLATFLLFFLIAVYFIYFLEVKLSADFEARIGPNRNGLAGIGAPLAFGLRWIFSESPAKLDRSDLDLFLSNFFLYFSIGLSPFLGSEAVMNNEVGIPTATLSLLLSIFFLMRQKGQGFWLALNQSKFISGILSLVVLYAATTISNGGLRWLDRQEDIFWLSPLLIIRFFSLVTTGLLLLVESPFSSLNLPEGAFNGYRRVIFEYLRKAIILYWIVFSILLTWPVFASPETSGPFFNLVTLVLVLSVAVFIYCVSIWISRSLVVLRSDQVTAVATRFLFPLSFIVLLGELVMRLK